MSYYPENVSDVVELQEILEPTILVLIKRKIPNANPVRFESSIYRLEEEKEYQINCPLTLKDIQDENYHIELVSDVNLTGDKALYTTYQNDTIINFGFCAEKVDLLDDKELECKARDMEYAYNFINMPFYLNKHFIVYLYDIQFKFNIVKVGDYMYPNKIRTVMANYHIARWMPNIQTGTLGLMEPFPREDLFDYVGKTVMKITPDYLKSHDFGVLMIMPFYSGDIYLLSIEPDWEGGYQYYIAAHLHKANCDLEKCNSNCISQFKSSDIEKFNDFIHFKSDQFRLSQKTGKDTIIYKGEPFIIQRSGCCKINTNILEAYWIEDIDTSGYFY